MATTTETIAPLSPVDMMRAMAAKYSTEFPIHIGETVIHGSTAARLGRDVVLVTGTTGSLGCHLLETLVSAQDVGRIYALNRAAKDNMPLRERQALGLIERGIDTRILDSSKVVLLEGDLTKPDWGLHTETFLEVHHSVTHIIHNAWRVDMNAKLPGFEPVIRGLRSLIDFALTSPLPSPPRLMFTSSMVIMLNGPRDRLVPEAPVPPELALMSGYSQSKWVAEQILQNAGARTALDPLVCRVGQVSGGPSGDWAPNEWYPIMVQSATQVGCFPEDPRPVNIIPFDIAAAAIADFRKASNANHTVHLIHPRPVPWDSIASVIASELGVPLVPYEEWLGRVEAAARSLPQLTPTERKARMRALRAILLIPYFRSLQRTTTSSYSALNWPDPDVALAKQASPTLDDPNLRQLGPEDVRKWLAYWRKVGLLPSDRQARL